MAHPISPEVAVLIEFIKNYPQKESPHEKKRCLEGATQEILSMFWSREVRGKLELARRLHFRVNYPKIKNQKEKRKIAKIGDILLNSLKKDSVYIQLHKIIQSVKEKDSFETIQVPRAEKVLEEAGKRELINRANTVVKHEISAGRITPEDLKAAREAGLKGAQERIDALLGRRPRNGGGSSSGVQPRNKRGGSSSSQNSRRSGSERPPKAARRV